MSERSTGTGGFSPRSLARASLARIGGGRAATPGVLDVEQVRLRWSGHGQFAELTIVVDRDASLVQAHRLAHEVEHRLLHGMPHLVHAHVHPHPAPVPGTDDHAPVAHHVRALWTRDRAR